MQIDGTILAEVCRVITIALDGGFKSLEDLASALERIAATVRVRAARQRAEVNGDRLIG